MRIIQMMKSILEGIVAVAGAFVMSQLPIFMQQYMQRLGGHVEELTGLLNSLQQNATLSNKTLAEYIQKFRTNDDPDFALQGEFMSGIATRWQSLKDLLDQLTQSTLWEKPFVFFKGLQGSIFHSTLENFQPGINLTAEGLIYAGVGILLALAIYHLILNGLKALGRLFFGGRSEKQNRQDSQNCNFPA